MRKLQITKAGYWYVVLTIAMGVVALATANNVLYLMESLLLGGMILSGVISERAIVSVELELALQQAVSQKPSRDELLIRNPSRFSFFCLEFGEWNEGRFTPIAFVTKIGAHETLRVPAPRIFPARGTHEWEGLGIATAAPFGFARKIRILRRPGKRLIWPENAASQGRELRESRLMGAGVADAEVRSFTLDEDIRHVLWKLSAKGVDPVARKSRLENPLVRLTLELSSPSDTQFENRVRAVAGSIYVSDPQLTPDIRLRIIGAALKKTLVGRIPALNFLATVRPEAPKVQRGEPESS